MRVANCSCGNTVCSCGGSCGVPKEAVYHGQEPYPKGHEGFGPYTKWTQAHQRDLDESDYTAILKSAREWMKAPGMKLVEGEVKDTQLRAALDLAIRDMEDGRYSGAIQPVTYNMLLARLANTKDESGATVRQAAEKSTYVNESQETIVPPPSPKKGPISQTAKQMKLFAAKLASKNPSMAFELVELADKLATTTQEVAMPAKEAGYDALKEAVIKAASESPAAQQVLASVLRLIKTQEEARQIRASQTSPTARKK